MKKNALLIHGWDYLLYTKMTDSNDAWEEYSNFTNMLSRNYNVYKINFPGFCGENEPKEKEWDIENYSNYIHDYISNHQLKIDILIGYSFGGAVAIDYVNRYKSNAKLFLIAPAIIRNNYNSRNFIKTPSFLKPFRNIIRNWYVTHIIKNNEMRFGTSFLKNSYQTIVREDKRNDLYNIDYKKVYIVYGNKDTAVNPQEILNTLKKEYLNRIFIIPNANHDNIITDYVKDLERILIEFF